MRRAARAAEARRPPGATPAPEAGAPAVALEAVARQVAAALGIDFARLTVRADGEAAARVRARGARGVSAGTTILLDGARLDGTGAAEVVAHEVVHVAQRGEGGRASARRRPDAAAAEREARRLARRFAEGRPLPRPLATLPGDGPAADVDWAGLDDLRASLDAYDAHVAASRPHEWQTVQDAVGADGSVGAEQADLVVRTLSALPVPVARALLHRLPPAARWDVVRHLTAAHFDVHRPVAVAALSALDAAHAARVDADLLGRLDLLGLTPLERDVLLVALAQVPAAVVTELLQAETDHPERPPHWHDLVQGEGITSTPVTFVEGLAAEQAAAELSTEAGRRRQQEEVDGQARRLAALIRRDEEGALEAVGEIARLADELRPPVVRALEDQGHLARLLDVVDDHHGDGGPLAGPHIGTVLAARTTAANLATVDDRLSGGIFGWDWTEDIAITEADALVAFWALAALPLDVRERLLRSSDTGPVDRSDQGDVLDKMERNLPHWFVEGPSYRSLAVGRDRRGSLFERGEAHRAAWEREGTAGFLIELRRMISAGRTADALVALDTGRITDPEARPAAPGAAPAVLQEIDMTPEVRAALADRLDALDVMDGFLEDLPYEVRQGRDHRMELLRVCAARSVPNLLRHMSSLLHTGIEDWAVLSWEADLAHVLYRSLPPYEQLRYRRLGDITGEMSADIRTWSGTNLLDATTATARLEEVRAQLARDDLWVASRAGQLRALVGLAVALGDRRTPFERSRAVEAFRDPSLREIVRDFRLYDPGANRTGYVEERLENTPWYNEGPFYWSTLIGGFIWVALRDAFAGQFAFDLFNGRIGHREFDLGEMADLLGGHAGGARFAQRRDTERGRERNPDVTERANRAGLTYDQRENTLHVSIPELALEGLGILRTGWAASTGAIRVEGLTIDATFDTSNLRHPRTVELGVPSASIADVLVTTPQSALAVARVGLSGLHVAGAASTVEEHATTGRGAWTYIPVLGPMIEWVYLLVQALGLGMNASTQLGAGLTELRSARVEIAGVDVRGLLVGGVPIEQVVIGPVTLGWGGTRASYLQEQERALVARLATAPEGARRDRLVAQLARVREELPTALDEDRRLDELVRRSHRDPAGLTAADHDEIRRLQRGPGGVVVDTGTIELRGIGDIAERATIQRLSGEVAASAVTGGRLTDRALADRFRAGGPPTGIGDRLAAAGGLDLGAVDVTLRPPSLETLRRWRAEAEAAGGTGRTARLDLAIEQRQELDRLRSEQDRRIRAGEAPSATDAARVEELLGLLATSIHAEDVSAQVDTTTGVVTLGAERVTGGPIDTSGFGVRRFEVEGIRIPVSTDPSRLPALMLIPEQTEGLSDEARAQLYGDRARDTVTGAGLSVRRATLSDVRVGAGDSAVAEITVNGVRGGVVTPVE
ncbi:MAG TPA: DUF4157 domain-containing protein, partial [Acidimicrobiales bacterium]|nr:DUF4157 domain-containing protein [Acidimicrobiales bacterium]